MRTRSKKKPYDVKHGSGDFESLTINTNTCITMQMLFTVKRWNRKADIRIPLRSILMNACCFAACQKGLDPLLT